MANDLPPLNALRAFEAAARHSSYSNAAAELNVVHTSIARHVRNLEDWFGVKLFVRAGRYVRLTEEGQSFYKDVARIFGEIESATRALRSKLQTQVKLSIEPILMHQWFAKRFYSKVWQNKLRGFEIEIESSFQVSRLEKGEADLAIRHVLEPPPPSDTAQIVAPQITYPFVSPDVLSAHRYATPLHALMDQPLLYAHRPDSWRGWFQNAGLDFTSKLKLTRQADPRVVILAARAGNGALLISETLVQDDVAEGALTRASDIGVRVGYYVLLTSEEAAKRPAVQAARAFLLELLGTFGPSAAPVQDP